MDMENEPAPGRSPLLPMLGVGDEETARRARRRRSSSPGEAVDATDHRGVAGNVRSSTATSAW
jgi:succinyl-CoA synthetase beta subunit/citryl-CoA synthetase large subunit